MNWLSKIDNPDWKEILTEDYKFFKQQISELSGSKRYYVYVLCDGSIPFYIGKGSGNRAYDHIKLSVRGNKNFKSRFISSLEEPPTVTILHKNLTEQEAIELEEQYISVFKRLTDGGILFNIMEKGIVSKDEYNSIRETCKFSGVLSYLSGKGIHSTDYDRSTTTKTSWANGCFDHIDFHKLGIVAGNVCAAKQKGIHSPEYQHKRSEWAKNGAVALQESGNRSGSYSKKWQEQNKEKHMSICSEGGKIGGKIVGSLYWWTDGIVNKKSMNKPNDNFYRGMTKGKKNV